MNNIEKQLIELHQRLQQEVSARKSLITYIDAKVYSLQKDESIILEEINKVLSTIKNSEVSSGDVQLEIEITQFKNNMRKLIKETTAALESKINAIHEELYDLIMGAEKTATSVVNNQINGLIESNKKTNELLTIIKQNLTDQLEDLRVNGFQVQDRKIIKLDKSFKELKDASNAFKSEIEKTFKDFSSESENKIKAIAEFYKTKIENLEMGIKEIEENQKIEFAPIEQETIVPKEQTIDLLKLSDLQKENVKIYKELKDLSEDFDKLKKSLETKIKIFSNGTPNVQLFLKETLSTINDIYSAVLFFKDTLVETKKILNNLETDFKDFSKRLQKLESSQKKFITDKQLDNVKIIIADKADNLEIKLKAEIEKLSGVIEEQAEEIKEKDKKIEDLEKASKVMEDRLFILETNYNTLSEEIEFLMDFQELKEVSDGTK